MSLSAKERSKRVQRRQGMRGRQVLNSGWRVRSVVMLPPNVDVAEYQHRTRVGSRWPGNHQPYRVGSDIPACKACIQSSQGHAVMKLHEQRSDMVASTSREDETSRSADDCLKSFELWRRSCSFCSLRLVLSMLAWIPWSIRHVTKSSDDFEGEVEQAQPYYRNITSTVLIHSKRSAFGSFRFTNYHQKNTTIIVVIFVITIITLYLNLSSSSSAISSSLCHH